MKNLHNLSGEFSLLHEYVNELRNVDFQSNRLNFRRNLERIGEIAALEISKTLPTEAVEIKTPLGVKAAKQLAQQPVVMTILRAGIPLFQGVLNYFDKADSGFVGAYRHHTDATEFTIKQNYFTSPNIAGRPLIVTDPMLATGASLVSALEEMMALGTPSVVHVVCAIAAQQGIDFFQQHFPDAVLWCADIDSSLNEKGYIIPGLGDAGDLSFGAKLQS
ncbi:MAG: uracil phosphoribosyltransferase [Weeksellaceae bacterium]|nr:uracil phosphoribosyltransferase [Weeksellaceae bacterium]